MSKLLEYREDTDSWYFTGDLNAARAYLRVCYGPERLHEVTKPDGSVTVGEGPAPDDLWSWGSSLAGSWDEAWRYFAGVDFGPVDEEYDEDSLAALLANSKGES